MPGVSSGAGGPGGLKVSEKGRGRVFGRVRKPVLRPEVRRAKNCKNMHPDPRFRSLLAKVESDQIFFWMSIGKD